MKIGRGLYRRKTRKGGVCEKCGGEIKKGEDYISYSPYRGSPHIRCTKSECAFKQSEMTSSEHLANLYQAREALEIASATEVPDTILSELDNAIATAEEEEGSYNESADNMEEKFPGADTVTAVRKKWKLDRRVRISKGGSY